MSKSSQAEMFPRGVLKQYSQNKNCDDFLVKARSCKIGERIVFVL